jgi:poly-gamma-glutamate synthesis protein (capsule biosynthesis protein)
MKILVTGALFIADRYRGRDLCDSSIDALVRAADHRIVNLEAPITVQSQRHNILKKGPLLGATKETILPLLNGLGVNLVTLANNHIMDFGPPGLVETLHNLKSAGIAAVGAGLDLREAAKPVILEQDGTRIAILNFGENKWATAGRSRAGANPLDVIRNVRQIREAKESCEFVGVIIHGGREDYHFPTLRMVRQYRFYIEQGASVIVGHQPHGISGYEVHNGSPIFYGLGNFLFTMPSDFAWCHTGLVLGLQFRRGHPISWELIPVTQSKSDFSLSRSEGESGESALHDVEEYGRIIADEKLLAREWESYLAKCDRNSLNFLSPFALIRNAHLRSGLTRLGIDRLIISKARYVEMLNTIRCETHLEATHEAMACLLK